MHRWKAFHQLLFLPRTSAATTFCRRLANLILHWRPLPSRSYSYPFASLFCVIRRRPNWYLDTACSGNYSGETSRRGKIQLYGGHDFSLFFPISRPLVISLSWLFRFCVFALSSDSLPSSPFLFFLFFLSFYFERNYQIQLTLESMENVRYTGAAIVFFTVQSELDLLDEFFFSFPFFLFFLSFASFD